MIDSYFKCALPLRIAEPTGTYLSSPRRDRVHNFAPIAGIFAFDSSDLGSTRRAFDDAETMKRSLETGGRRAFLSVWKTPKIRDGRWSNVWVIGESGTWGDEVAATGGGEA